MILASNSFNSKIAESTRQFRARLMYGTEEITGAIRSVEITSGACSEGSFTIGTVFSSYIEVVIDECEDILEDKELLLQIGVLLDGETFEYITIGYYTVTNPKTSLYSTTFTAVGRIASKLNVLIDAPEVPTLRNIADAITTKTGVAIEFNGRVSDAVLAKNVTGMTCREALSVIAGTFGGFATEDSYGNIVVSKFNTTAGILVADYGSSSVTSRHNKADKISVDGDRMTELPEFNETNFSLYGIKVVVSGASTDEEGNTIEEVSFTEGEPRLTMTNEYMTEDLFEKFGANTVGYTYRPGTVPLALGDPRLQPWDYLEVTDVKGNVRIVPCLNIVHTFDGGLTTTITAPGESEAETNYNISGHMAQQLDKLLVVFPKKVSELENDAEYITEEELKKKGYLTKVPDEYVTDEELEKKGYLTKVPDGYVTEEELKKKGYLTSIPDEYITKEELEEEFIGRDDFDAHTHLWEDITDRPFGKFPTEVGTNTVTSDDVIYGNFHRVSEFIPTLEDVQKGGSISYYTVSNGVITGELKTINFPQGDYTIGTSGDTGLMIRSDGIPMVVISFNGDPKFGAVTFPDITKPGVYFDQGELGKCIHSLTLNGYDGFKVYETRTIPKEYLPDDIGAVKTVNYIAPDEDGNINVEGGSGSGKADSAFKLLKSDTLTWNGDAEGKDVVEWEGEPLYVHISDIVLTSTELQGGGSYRFTDFEETYTFTSEDLIETEDYIVVNPYASIVVAKKDNVTYDGVTHPKQGLYIYYGGGESYLEYLTINGYTGFVKPILKMENMTPHGHDWYGKSIDKGNTLRSDDIIHGGYVKVSDSVPTEAELRKGGTIRFYNVEDGEVSGDLITGDYLGSNFSFFVNSDEITIWYGFSCLVVISRTGKSSGGISYNGIDGAGVYFYQGNEYFTMHSLTINDYTDFSYNLVKVPTELLPEDYIKQVASNSIDVPTRVSAFENDSGYITEITPENLPIDYIKQLIREVVEEIIGGGTGGEDGLMDNNGDYLYDVLQNKLITKE